MAEDPDGHAISFLALKRGTAVRAADGVVVGSVRRVQNNVREHIFDGIVIELEGGERRFVDAPEVARIYEHVVELTIASPDVASLPVPEGRVSQRLENTTTARRAKRFTQRLKDRWENR